MAHKLVTALFTWCKDPRFKHEDCIGFSKGSRRDPVDAKCICPCHVKGPSTAQH